MSAREAWEEVLAGLERRGIDHCLLRSDLAAGGPCGDADLLVEDDAFSEVLLDLRAHGWHVLHSSRIDPLRVLLVRWASDGLPALHLHRRVVEGGLVYHDAATVLARARRAEGRWIAAAEDRLVGIVVHDLLVRGAVRPRRAEALQELGAAADPRHLEVWLSRWGTPELAEAFEAGLSPLVGEPWSAAEVRRRLLKCLLRRPGNLGRRLRMRLLWAWRTRVSPRRRGAVVAFVGVDGAGKSSLIEALERRLEASPLFRVEVRYMGPWFRHAPPLDGLLRRLRGSFAPSCLAGRLEGQWARSWEEPPVASLRATASIIGKVLRGRDLSAAEQRLQAELAERDPLYLTVRILWHKVARTLFLLGAWLDMWRRWGRIRALCRAGKLVLADRWIDDLLVGSPHHRRGASPLAGILRRLFPAPDLLCSLHQEAEVVATRNDEVPTEEIAAIDEVYREAARRRGGVRVRTDRPPQELADEILRRALGLLVERARV